MSAQSFLKKLSKAVVKEVENQVTKEVSKQVGKGVEKGLDKLTDGKQQQDQPQQQAQQQAQQPQAQVQPQAQAPAQQPQPQAQAQAQTPQNQSQFKPNRAHPVQTIEAVVPYGPTEGEINGHKWVDLGLPSGTRWATCNVDASVPEQPGKHYSWGEVATKTSYAEANTKTYRKALDDISGDKTYDVATAKWGEGWRMPTQKEFSELAHYCIWRYVQKGGRWGAELTNPKNGRSIFLPATGMKDGTKLSEPNGCGMYWTSTPYKSETSNGAHSYIFGGALGEMSIGERYYGYAIRPVADYDVKTDIVPSDGEINGHTWVDLGLPSGTKWATYNLGATTPDGGGDHYYWGEISTYTDKTSKKNELRGKDSGGDIVGKPKYDPARAIWGGSWRMPTEAELIELMEHCTWEWTTLGRRNGMKVTSKVNGKYIFLPASGVFESSYDVYGYPHYINERAFYWSSTPNRNDSYHYTSYSLDINNSRYIMLTCDRYRGHNIRPVSD